MKAVHFGAGNIGRGFLGQLYWQSGYETVFVDVDPSLVALLNERKGYTIHVVGEKSYELRVGHVRGVSGKEKGQVAEEILSCDIASTAVGKSALPEVAEMLAMGVRLRAERGSQRPLNVVICENLLGAASVLQEMLLERVPARCRDYAKGKVGLVESVVSRMVPVITEEQKRKDPLAVYVEEYCILPVDATGFVGEIPAIKGMEPRANIRAYEERKLFTHNCGHALAAYFGFEKEYRYIWESIEEAGIRELVERGLWESGQALIKKHGFTEEEHRDQIRDLLDRFGNRPLGDTIARVGRDPLRKLGPQDRLVGAARLAMEYGVEPRVLTRGIASALRYRNDDDPSAVRLAEMMVKDGLDAVMEKVCGISKGERLYELVRSQFEAKG